MFNYQGKCCCVHSEPSFGKHLFAFLLGMSLEWNCWVIGFTFLLYSVLSNIRYCQTVAGTGCMNLHSLPYGSSGYSTFPPTLDTVSFLSAILMHVWWYLIVVYKDFLERHLLSHSLLNHTLTLQGQLMCMLQFLQMYLL